MTLGATRGARRAISPSLVFEWLLQIPPPRLKGPADGRTLAFLPMLCFAAYANEFTAELVLLYEINSSPTGFSFGFRSKMLIGRIADTTPRPTLPPLRSPHAYHCPSPRSLYFSNSWSCWQEWFPKLVQLQKAVRARGQEQGLSEDLAEGSSATFSSPCGHSSISSWV